MSLPKKRTSEKQNFPFPRDGATVYETPPTLIWTPREESRLYTVSARDGAGREVFRCVTDTPFAYDNKRWPAGRYTWQVTDDAGRTRGEESFVISEDAVFFDRPSPTEVFSAIPTRRPRHLFFIEDIPSILASRTAETETLRRNVALALSGEPISPPRFHVDDTALPYREYFGMFRDACDRDLVALALGYILLGDSEAGEEAARRLMALCKVATLDAAAVNGKYGDEVGLSMARCLPSLFDILYPLLNSEERHRVGETVALYARQSLSRAQAINYAANPSNSHVGRLPAYIGEAALVLKGEGVVDDETLIEWLTYALDVFCGPFPHYGTQDGAWAESAFYATSYTKWYLPFFSAVERYSGKSLLHRPFYMRYSQFALHFCSPSCEIHPFGDGYWCSAEDEEWPGFFAQNPYRVYADRFGPKLAREKMAELTSPNIFKLHLLDVFLPIMKDESDNPLTGDAEPCALFPDGGYVAMHTALGKENDLCLLARATPFPQGSHRHKDQGSFALLYGGEALITPSGYFGRGYGTRHHKEWTRETKAHNVILVDGKGQRTDLDAAGEIVDFKRDERECTLSLGALYDGIVSYTRHFKLSDGALTVTDEIVSECDTEIIYPLHTKTPPTLSTDFISVARERARMRIIPPRDMLRSAVITDEYDVDLNEDVPMAYRVSMPKQYHVYLTSGAAKRHLITVRLEVEGADQG